MYVIAVALVIADTSFCAAQNIQELTPNIAEKHGLSLRLWPTLNEVFNPFPLQQIGKLSLEESCTGTEQPQTAASQQAEDSTHQRAASRHHELNGSSSCSGCHDQQTARGSSRPESGAADKPSAQATSSSTEAKAQQDPSRASAPAAEAANGHCQAAGTEGDARDQGMRSSAGSEQPTLSRGECVPGHSWLPCPRLTTPDAAESDYLTVSTFLFLACSSAAFCLRAMLCRCEASILDCLKSCYQKLL